MGEPRKGGRRKEERQPFTDIFCRLTAKMSQKEIAEAVGVSRQNVGRWRTGSSVPDASALIRIADALNVSVDYLLGRTDIKTTEPTMKAACDFTKLSELAADNVRRSRYASLLLESEEFGELVDCLHKVKIAIPDTVGAKAARHDAETVFDKIVDALGTKATPSEVTVTCYGETKHYNSKEEAVRFFSKAAQSSSGSELERYARILTQLANGRLDCSDSDDSE